MIKFDDWRLSDSGGVIAQQYDDNSRELSISGAFPAGWQWQLLMTVDGYMDVLPLETRPEGLGITLTEEMLAVSGWYTLQLKGTDGTQTRHTNQIWTFVPESLSGNGQWPVIPSEFTLLEARIKALEEAAARSAATAGESAESAAGSAAAAKGLADSVDAEQLNARIAEKGDNLEFDTESNLLYLTSGGERIGDGIAVATGSGGGGGGASNNAVLTLNNTTGWIYKSIASGASCKVTFEWSSLENEMETGSGILKVTVGGSVKHTAQIAQGEQSLEVGGWVSAGTNAIKLNVTDVYGNSRTLSYSLTVVALNLASPFDPLVAYSGEIEWPYIPTGSAVKTMHFKVDGKEIGTDEITPSGRQQTFTIPAQAHGSHAYEAYFTAEIDGETVESNHLYYDLICTEEGNTTPIIATSFRQKTAEQYESIVIPYVVYDPAGLTAAIVLSDGETNTPLTVDRTQQTWTYRPEFEGELTLAISCGNSVKLIEMDIAPSSIEIEAETASLALHLTSYGRSNNEENPSDWRSGDTVASLTGFNFVSDGWMSDEDGITVLRVGGDARVEIPAQIFATDFRTGGKTIEIEFATRDVLNYDAVVISCWSGERGLKITAQKALLKSEQSEISTQYKEDEHVRLSFVVEKRSAHRLLMIYINGILSGAIQYPADDDFSQNEPVGISIGSGECTTDIYCIRVYNNDLTRYQILDNWIADTQVLGQRIDRYKHNDVFDEYGQIVIDQLPADLPYLILTGPALPTYKGNKLTVSGQYVDPVDSSKSFTFTGAEIDVQGTSSASYERKNYKIKYKGGFVQNGVTVANYLLGEGNVPTNTFTFKADVASSEGANNVELVKLYEDVSPYRIPPQEEDERVRQGIDGYPIVIFHNDGNAVTFIGKYNFNHDKGTPEVFGFAAGDESWETLNNTSNRALWKSADFSGTAWQSDFEARYPDKNTDATRLAELAAWLVSTDRSAVDTEEEKAERLAKFKAEFSDHLELESALFYYLFTELFLLADSRAKNAFPTKYGDHGWCWLPYDMDTAIGINNEGKLAFGYELEDTDLVNGAKVYNGQESVLWNNLRDAFPEELMAMYQQLRSDGGLSYEDTERRFAEHQAKWPVAIFNEDAYFKYLAPLFEKNNGSYLGMLQGSKAEQRKWWLYNRFRYIDSKYNAGDALKDFITLRGYAKGDVTIVPYADIYATVKYGSYLVQERALRGGSYRLECPVDDLDDTEIYIYSASQIAELGDLSDLMVGYAEFAAGTKLKTLKLGNGAAGYSNPNLTQLYLGNNVLLKTLDVRNCPNLGSTAADVNATASIDISGCTNIEEVYFDNTAITGVTLPNGGILKKLHLPGTMTNLTLRNQTALTEFVMPSYANISTLRLENVPGVVDGWTILHQIPANSRVRMIGFDWEQDSPEAVLELYDYLDTMRGLDENGNNVDTAQMSGTIHIDALTGAQLAEMQRRYPSIRIDYQSLIFSVVYTDWDGTPLYTAECLQGAAAIDPVALGYIDAPTRDGGEDIGYAYIGWGELPTNVQSNLTLVAQYETTYAVRFCSEGNLLHTQFVIAGGNAYDPVAEGEITAPAKAGTDDIRYTYTGWDSSLTNVTAVRSVNAVYSEIYAVRFYNDAALLDTQWIASGGDAVDPVSSGTVSTPTKAATAQYTYAYKDWDKALTGVTAPRSIYATYTETLRKYTVKWMNGSTVLETDAGVPYGTVPTYNGSDPVDTDGKPWQGWSPEVAPVTGDATYTAVFEDPSVAAWEAVAASIAAGTYKTDYAIGDTVPLNLGSEGVINMQIAAFDVDTLADGSGTAAISWVAKELFVNARRMNVTRVKNDDGTYQEGTGGCGGWEMSELRDYLNDTVKPLLPTTVRSMIAKVTKTQTAHSTTNTQYSQTTEDEVWIPGRNEVFISPYIYKELFPDDTSRQKGQYGGTNSNFAWWLRDSQTVANYYVCSGFSSNAAAYQTKGVCLGFCTGRTPT